MLAFNAGSYPGNDIPPIGIEMIRPDLPADVLERRARQLAHLVADMQDWYLTAFPGTERVDTDPPPNPDDERDRNWRIDRLLASGSVQEAGLQYFAAFKLDDEDQPLETDDAIAGLIVLTKEEGERCTPTHHYPTWISEFYVRQGMRGHKLGHALLRAAAETSIHAEDDVLLDVAQPNVQAQNMYSRRYGFSFVEGVIVDHEVFNFSHLQMSNSGRILWSKLGIFAK